MSEEIEMDKKIRPKKGYVAYGVYYGYPDCCIKEFCELLLRKRKPTIEQILTGKGSGFIPCLECCEKVKEGMRIEEILVNRKCPMAFPEDGIEYDEINLD